MWSDDELLFEVFMPEPNCDHRPRDWDSTGRSWTSDGVKWHTKSFKCVKMLMKWLSESFAAHIPSHEITWNSERIIRWLCSSSVISLNSLALASRLQCCRDDCLSVLSLCHFHQFSAKQLSKPTLDGLSNNCKQFATSRAQWEIYWL